MIEFLDVNKNYINKKQIVSALQHISLRVENGDVFGVIGFSGAGKSTLIRMINALEKPTQGHVLIDGTDISDLSFSKLQEQRKNIGMIFQQFNLLNSKSVFENIAIPLILDGKPRSEITKRVKVLMDFVELSDKKDFYPDQLSGGQKQRVGIARALVRDPAILLSDEATSALDPDTMESILDLLKRINKEWNITIVIVTHQIRAIQKICNKVAVMKAGKIVETGSVLDVFSHPKEIITQNFVRTVIPDRIPSAVWELIKKEKRCSCKIIRMQFMGKDALSPLIYKMNIAYPVETRILHAAVTELGDQPFGIMILQMVGEEKDIMDAVNFAKAHHVLCEEVQDLE